MKASSSKEPVKFTKADLWRMYREPVSIDAPIPVSIVLEVLRGEEPGDVSGAQRALRFSKTLAQELGYRGGFDDCHLSYLFEGEALSVDGPFYRDRLKNFAGDENAANYEELSAFVRETYVNNLMVPLRRLVALSEENRLHLPRALLARCEILERTSEFAPGAAAAKRLSEERDENSGTLVRDDASVETNSRAGYSLQIIGIDAAAHILGNLPKNATQCIEGRQQALTSRSVALYLREQGYSISVNDAQKALSRVKNASPGRPLKTS